MTEVKIAMNNQPLPFFLRVFALSFSLLLSACGLVDVKLGSIPTPTIAPIPTETALPPRVEAAAGLVAYNAPDDDSVLVRTIAYPHLLYFPGGVTVEMFDQSANPQEYMVITNGLGFRLRANWDALWLSDAYGTGHVVMDVYWKPPGHDDFEYAQYAATEDWEVYGADFRNELLDATLYFPEAGVYGVRAVLTVAASDGNGSDFTDEMTYETEVVALNSPESIESSALQPPFGDLENNGLLLDWRGWAFGPCFIKTEDNPEATRALDQACSAVESGDGPGAQNALQAALDTLGDDPVLQGRLRQQMGTLAAVAGQWNAAARHFGEALSLWQNQYNAFEVGIALHNLATALLAAQHAEEAAPLLDQAGQLRDQMGDYPAATLTWAELAYYYWQSVEALDYYVQVLNENGLPQAAVVQAWADALRQSQS